MRLRFTGEVRGKRPWQYCKGTYSPEAWAKAKRVIHRELSSSVVRTPVECMLAWQGEVRKILARDENKRRRKSIAEGSRLRQAHVALIMRAKSSEGSEKKRVLAMAERCDRQLCQLRIRQEAESHRLRRQASWGHGPRGAARVFASAREEVHEDVSGLARKEVRVRLRLRVGGGGVAAAVRTEERELSAAEVASAHLERIFNVHRTHRAGKDSGHREQAVQRLLDMVRANAPATHEVRKAMRGLSIKEMFCEKNVKEAIEKSKKGTVPGRCGFDVAFYAQRGLVDGMAEHLSKLFQWIARSDSQCMTEAMRRATVSVLYRGGR